MNKKSYIKPEVKLNKLDFSISLQMQSSGPHDPGLRPAVGSKGTDKTFDSPFGDKTFN